MANSLGVDLHDKVLEIDEAHLLPVVRGPENLKRRLVRATGGFGCSPHTGGRAVFVTWLIDGDTGRLDGYDFARIVPEDEAARVLGLPAPEEPDFSQPLQPTYIVRWEMSFGPDEGVTTPELAAKNALHIMRDPASIATSFDVFIEGESEPVLTEYDADPPDPDNLPDDGPPRPTTLCSCGHELIWVEGGWQHNVADYIWGNDHDAQPDDEPDAEGRKFWDREDCITEDEG